MSDLANVPIIANQRLLNQASQNLITNAIKYSEQGGTIDITHTHDPDQIRLNITEDGQCMSPETQSRLFERFYKASNHDNSNCLGLAIAKAIFELHNGTSEVTSTKYGGTTFTVTIHN